MITEAEAKKMAAKVAKDLSFNLNNKSVNLISSLTTVEPKNLQLMMNVYDKSKITQYLSNLACWVAKLSI
jgi:hypothetical protein